MKKHILTFLHRRWFGVLLITVILLYPYAFLSIYAAPFNRWQNRMHTKGHSYGALPEPADNVSVSVKNATLLDSGLRSLGSTHSLVKPTLLAEAPLLKTQKAAESFYEPKTTPTPLVTLEQRSQANVPNRHIRPALAEEDSTNKVEINLEKADLSNLLQWFSTLFKIDIISGDIAVPPVAGKVQGNIISFHTHAPLTKKQAWDLLLNFLNLFGLTLVPTAYENNYPKSFSVVTTKDANKTALPSFIGTSWKDLPENDTKIRYVYFVDNGTASTLLTIVKEFVSPTATVVAYGPLNALIFSDKASNIKSVMRIVAELDSISVPETMSVLRLRHANAEDVAQLYNALVSTEQEGKPGSTIARILGQKRQPTTVYFPPNTRVIPEKRTNSLIVLGSKEGIEKVEAFVLKHVDTSLQQPYSPLYVYELQYTNATDMATILTNVTQFASSSSAAQFGGVRDGNKFLRPITFVAEPSGNRLLIKAEKEDYLAIRSIIQELDVLQPQVNIEVLIVNVTANKQKELGVQLRNKDNQTLGNNINFQTSGVRAGSNGVQGIITNPTGSLIGNLVSLAQGQGPGATLISIGNQLVGGVWALFKILDTYVHSNVISHPFLSSTNKYTAQVSLGETRRVKTGQVQSAGANTDTEGDVNANLTVKITPQINRENMINLDIDINIEDFTSGDPTSATKDTKSIKTNAIMANKEILAIGGLIVTTYQDTTSKVPLLGNVPVFGWLFKDKFQQQIKSNLLVFISAEVFLPEKEGGLSKSTQKRLAYAESTMDELTHPSEPRDPIYRWFFDDHALESQNITDRYITQKSPCDTLCPLEDSCEKVIEFIPNQGVVTRRGNVLASTERKPSLSQLVPTQERVNA